MEWTTEQKRALANLRYLPGYVELIKYFDEKASEVLKDLTNATGRDTVYELAVKFAVWTETVALLKNTPETCENVLKQEGDVIYG